MESVFRPHCRVETGFDRYEVIPKQLASVQAGELGNRLRMDDEWDEPAEFLVDSL
jgi:hypothetical protein